MRHEYAEAIDLRVAWHRVPGIMGDDLVRPGFSTPLQCVESGETGWVAPEICQLVAREAVDLPSFPWHSALLPTLAAFIVLGSPVVETMRMPDGHSADATLEAIGYSTGGGDRATFAAYWRMHDGYRWCDVMIIEQGGEISDVLERNAKLHADIYRQKLSERGVNQRRAAEFYPDVAALWRRFASFTMALLLFMHQRIVQRSSQHVDRASQRRVARANLSPTPFLTVITFRRTETGTTEGECAPTDWSCRWAVRGHWRRSGTRR